MTRKCIQFLFFLFIFIQSGYSAPIEKETLVSEPASGFGKQLAIRNNWIIAGAAFNSPYMDNQGSIYWYHFENGAWSRKQSILGTAVNEHLGLAVAIDTFTTVVAAYDSIFVYHKSGDKWTQQQVLPGVKDWVQPVAIDGEWLAVSDVTDNGYTGAVNMYRLNGETWEFVETLRPVGASASAEFGGALALKGNDLIVGAPFDSTYGAVYSFQLENGRWVQKDKLLPVYNFTSYDTGRFGTSVAISDSSLLIGETDVTNPGRDESKNGKIIFYKKTNTSWQEVNSFYGLDEDRFGHNVAIDGNIAVALGDPVSNYYYPDIMRIYKKNNSNWSLISYQTQALNGGGWGKGLAIEGRNTIAGDESNNRFMIDELIAMPYNLSASQGNSSSRVKLNWSNRSTNMTSIKIFRDGIEIAEASPKATSYSDYNGIPGKVHRYRVAAWNSDWGNSTPVAASGWKPANGTVSGKIKTRKEAGVRNVKMNISATNAETRHAIDLSGTMDYLDAGSVSNFPDTAITVAYWMKVTGRDSGEKGTPFSYSTSDHPDNALTIWNSFEQIAVNDQLVVTGIELTENTWHHITVTWRSSDGRLKLYHDGLPDSVYYLSAGEPIAKNGRLIFGQDQDSPGGPFYGGQAFVGLLDEMQIWNFVRNDSVIAADMYKKYSGTEPGLVSYWPSDDASRSSGRIVADITKKGGNHALMVGASLSADAIPTAYGVYTDAGGAFKINNIFYGQQRDFSIKPFKEGHGFDPDAVSASLDLKGAKFSGIAITDTTSLTVSGKIMFVGANCAVPNVELILNGKKTGVFTNNAGEYRLTIDEPGFYTIKPELADSNRSHSFTPKMFSGNIFDNINNMDFEDQTQSIIKGKIAAACNNFIGVGTLHILSDSGQNGCLDSTFSTDENGNYQLSLPAQPYIVEVLSLDPPNPLITAKFEATHANLTFQDTVLNFVYRTPPIVRIEGLPEICPGAKDPFRVPVVGQYEKLNLIINVLEAYKGDTCAVDTGYVDIYDDIGGNPDQAVRLPIHNGRAYYSIDQVGTPNILDGGAHPYQKLLEVVANAEGQITRYDQWLLVTGNRPREKTFVTRTPELPFLILHDPPGDNSYAYWQKDSSYTKVHSLETQVGGGAGAFVNAKIGSGIKVPFVGEVGAFTHVEGQFLAGGNNNTKDEVATTWSFSENIRTATDADFTGENGDIVMGGSFNLIYALTDVIGWDENTCSVIRDTSLAWGAGPFATTYIYTINHIRNTLLPNLRTLKSLASPDSARLLQTYIDVWEQVVKDNHEAIVNSTAEKNISFSGGISREYSETTGKSKKHSYNFTAFIDANVKIGLGFHAGQINESEYGAAAQFHWSQDSLKNTDKSSSTTVGYVLSDDDVGDFFTVDVGKDKIYGTPVFKLVSGTSSCPFEAGTQPRDEPVLNINTFRQDNIPPDKTANFILNLGNQSESGETRDYTLSVLQSSNYDGAVIRVGGVVVEKGITYTIPAGQQITATMSVTRGPVAYSYNNLKLVLASACDASRSDTVAFSVNFRSDCPTVDLYQPINHWLVNQADHDSLLVILRNYDKTNPLLKKVSLQYRKIGDAWKTALSWQASELPDDFIYQNWYVGFLADGKYELRAVSSCGANGVNYSDVSEGVIDRSSLYAFGTPQPSDGVLNLGEDIRAQFTAALNCAGITSNNIRLTDLTDDMDLNFNFACNNNAIVITPTDSLSTLEGKQLQAQIADIPDQNGNKLKKPVTWRFSVNQNALYWRNAQADESFYSDENGHFDKVLKNISPLAKNYTLTAIPTWLSVTNKSGTVQGGSETAIHFEVNPGLNPGHYSDTLYASINGQGASPLFVTLNILAAPPDWQVQPSSYQYSMDIIAQIQKGDTFSKNGKDIIAVFAGDKIRGKGHLQFVPETNTYLAFITAYGNRQANETLHFKIWNAATGELSGFVPETVSFQNNSAIGKLRSPLTLHPSGRTQTIPLDTGWSWFSLNVEQQDMSPDNLLADLNVSDGDIIKSQTQMAVYMQSEGWVGTLNRLQTGMSYRIRLKNGALLSTPGNSVPVNKSIPVQKGWNWLGYILDKKENVNDALNGYSPDDGDRIKDRDQFAVYSAVSHSWQGALSLMRPGKGYLLYSQKGTALHYKQNAVKSGLTNEARAEAATVNLNPYDYEQNMNIVGAIKLGGEDARDSIFTIRAYAGNSLRGEGRLQQIGAGNLWRFFLTVYGTGDLDTLRFEVNDGSQTLPVREKTVFRGDAVMGTVPVPFSFSVKDEIPPVLQSAFHYSSAPGLSRFITIYINSSEALARPPAVLVASASGTESNPETRLFDAKNHIYRSEYTIPENGNSRFYITGTDYGNNSARLIKNLNVQSLDKSRNTTFRVDSLLLVSVSGKDVKKKSVLYTETFKRDTTLAESKRMLSRVYGFSSPDGFSGSINIQFKLSANMLNEMQKHQASLYHYDAAKETWMDAGGRIHGSELTATVNTSGFYAVILDEERTPVPDKYALHANYPNPFNPQTTIKFDMPEAGFVKLVIYNILGQKIKTLADDYLKSGYHTAIWNGRDALGGKVASGVYIYRLKTGSFVKSRKMILLK